MLSLQIMKVIDKRLYVTLHVKSTETFLFKNTLAKSSSKNMGPPNHTTATMTLFIVGGETSYFGIIYKEIIEKEKPLCKFIFNAMLSSTVSLKIK